MKKSNLVAYLAGALAVASLQAQEPMPTNEGAVTEPPVKSTRSMTSLSARFGYMGFREGFLDDGLVGQVEFKMPIDESDFDFVVRGHYAVAETDDGKTVRSVQTYRYGQWYVMRVTMMENCEETVYGGSAQIQYNFKRNESVNPYIAGGVMFERTAFEYDLGYFGSRPASSDNAGRHQKGDEDGFAIVGRVGVEFNPDPFYARLEAAFVSEIYEEDDGRQIEFNAIVGAKITDSIRIDVAGTRFTDWKEYYITAGLTYLF